MKKMLKRCNRETMHHLSSWFLRGLLLELPIIVTIGVLAFFLAQAESWFGDSLAILVRAILPESWLALPFLKDGHIPGLPLIVWIGGTILLGRFALYRIGERGFRLIDHVFLTIPGINVIYKFVREIASTIAEKKSFQRVVWVHWPHQNTLTLALVSREIEDTSTGKKWVACLVASVPNTTTGYVNLFPAEDVWDAHVEDETLERLRQPMRVAEAMKMLISLGTRLPERMPIMSARDNGDSRADG